MGVKEKNKESEVPRVFFRIFFSFVKKLWGGGGGGPAKFQGLHPQPAPHRAGGPNRAPWSAPWVQVLVFVGQCGDCEDLLTPK